MTPVQLFFLIASADLVDRVRQKLHWGDRERYRLKLVLIMVTGSGMAATRTPKVSILYSCSDCESNVLLLLTTLFLCSMLQALAWETTAASESSMAVRRTEAGETLVATTGPVRSKRMSRRWWDAAQRTWTSQCRSACMTGYRTYVVAASWSISLSGARHGLQLHLPVDYAVVNFRILESGRVGRGNRFLLGT